MRVLVGLTALLALTGAALAGEGPTKEQCKMGWKSEYSKMWTKEQFMAACKSMM
jgi:hypothetical protein